MAKIAVEFEPSVPPLVADSPAGRPARHLLASGDGWSVSHVVCTAGPRDRPFEEQHSDVCIAIVTGGSFQYRSSPGCELMTSGSLFLGNAGQHFECRHDHGVGDRCISFSYQPRYFEALAAENGIRSRNARFSALRVPPVRELSSLIARACACLAQSHRAPPNRAQRTLSSSPWNPTKQANRFHADLLNWEEIAVELAGLALDLTTGGKPNCASAPAAEARVSRIARWIDDRPEAQHELGTLACEAKLSRYHFLRMFRQLIGLTPHQYVLRARLRRAAMRLMLDPARVLDIALDSGFGDVSNFNHAFRAEFGASPRSWRLKL